MRDRQAFNQVRGGGFALTAGLRGPERWANELAPAADNHRCQERAGADDAVALLDRWRPTNVVIASKGGEPTHPTWHRNPWLPTPDVTLEVGGDTFLGPSEVAEGAERRRLFDQQAAQMPFFAEYERKTPREIPVVVLCASGDGLLAIS